MRDGKACLCVCGVRCGRLAARLPLSVLARPREAPEGRSVEASVEESIAAQCWFQRAPEPIR